MTVGDGTEWALEGGQGQTLVFEGRRIAGFGGVNRYAGEYTLDGEELTLGPLAMTRMAGPPEAMESERHYLDALGRPRGRPSRKGLSCSPTATATRCSDLPSPHRKGKRRRWS